MPAPIDFEASPAAFHAPAPDRVQYRTPRQKQLTGNPESVPHPLTLSRENGDAAAGTQVADSQKVITQYLMNPPLKF